MRPSRTLSTAVFALYLLLAGTLPVLDAMLERSEDVAVGDRGPLDRAPGAPHGDSCPLCTIIDRASAVAVAAVELPRIVATFAGGLHWLDLSAAHASALAPALGARAPPPPVA